ncbi:PspC domain-containing protein [Myroides pelagicus]|uniref:PspC domain-containing protein n=1 Tax=Myroides pelagicus TaxID=270914 RepID=A0A7K1GJ22_9FLAO|nr:PspC domain-containing protein [Myroides pelagicus]MEC4113726.1 PspC domain-containing protein [Myroides pelagicus]MTH28816.1 PspC domain-containing protein [Myroides pelagicus]
MINRIRYFFEKHGFQVSSRIGDRLGIKAMRIRLLFIYLSFFTLGLTFPIYLTLAFMAKIKDLIYTKRSSVFDL